MKLCVFAGTFNPIHKTHLKMAHEALQNYDKVLFIPAYKPPHKDFDPEMSRHRLEMVKIATRNEPRFEVSDIEFQSERKRPDEVIEPSYTYNTILKLNYPGKVGFIIGSDAYAKIDTWYKADELKKMVDFIVFPRVDDVSSSGFRRAWSEANAHGAKNAVFGAVDNPRSEFRANHTQGIVTKEVECYIKEHGLY